MKVLVTGMASSHTKPSTSTSFFGTLVKGIETFASVEWATPSVTWTKEFLDGYDSIIIGVVPPTSLGANKVYGAMHAINVMYDSPKLRLVVDHPQIWQFKSSLAAIDRDVANLFTEFYSKRREFKLAIQEQYSTSIKSAATRLLTQAWPKTIYPAMPWKTTEDVAKFIATVDPSRLIGINIDAHLLTEPYVSAVGTGLWVADNPKSTWTKKVEKLLALPVAPLKSSNKEDEMLVSDRLASSFGVLIAPHDRGVGTWWSPRYIQAMNYLVPIYSDWSDTGKLSESWYILGSSIEELTPEQRRRVALAQRTDYINAIPTKEESLKLLESVVRN
jgi:hypothetical protein